MNEREAVVERVWLHERRFVVGNRVGSERYPHTFGTIRAVEHRDRITVAWDSGRETVESWIALAPLRVRVLGEVAP